ncbi:hypothetical protein B0H13DRAFT_475185 [Mycena leptocephala]|nr:hypothetical protein B0H13DRAFT_475185 [Mycena leptocephala]
MTKRAQPAAQPKGTNTQVQATPAETGRLALVHFDELFAIWPADPRIPSVESRRAWALARNITPSYVHAWFQRRRPAAKKLKLKIPDETYELPVGTPPVVPIVIKDEPVESEVPAPTNESAPKKTKKKANVKIEADVIVTPMPPTKQPKKKKADIDSASVVADPEPTKKNTKRKREELSSDDLPEPTTQPKNRTKKTTPETPSDNATDQSKPKRSHKKIKTAPIKAEEAATLSAPPKESKKKSKKADNELASYNVAEQPAR